MSKAKCKLCDITVMANPGTCWKCVAAGFRSYKEMRLFEFEVEGQKGFLPRRREIPGGTKTVETVAPIIKTDKSRGVRCSTIDAFLKEGKTIPEVVAAMLALFPELDEKRTKQLAQIRKSRLKGQL